MKQHLFQRTEKYCIKNTVCEIVVNNIRGWLYVTLEFLNFSELAILVVNFQLCCVFFGNLVVWFFFLRNLGHFNFKLYEVI